MNKPNLLEYYNNVGHLYDNDEHARQRYEADKHAYEMDERIKAAGPSLTVQAPTEELDLNNIIKRFGITDGAIPPAAYDPSYYGDFSDSPQDFRDAIDKTRAAQLHFSLLPAQLRARWNNNPEELYQWITDPRNLQEAINLDLLQGRKTSDEQPTSSTSTATAVPPTT